METRFCRRRSEMRLGSRPGVGGCFHTLKIAQRALGLGDQNAERLGLVDRQIREHLAIDRNLSLAEAVKKSAVGHPVIAHSSFDALDPEGAKFALAPPPVAISVLGGLFDCLLG